MSDKITPEERQLIDEYITVHGINKIPRGMSSEQEPFTWGYAGRESQAERRADKAAWLRAGVVR